MVAVAAAAAAATVVSYHEALTHSLSNGAAATTMMMTTAATTTLPFLSSISRVYIGGRVEALEKVHTTRGRSPRLMPLTLGNLPS